ncbi:hypothetical protein HYH03_018177 [Edaphochlamys debaryana]|uniref:Uncharacterized protein n=1 Tax=Edaphochlamys debaryana TaxID=47281 RepID=A0A835XGG6_9CHLO|nr:hypothetical protein HYH03_018177 [Edaphochlamys debaryana]|eukprot:KAG2482895.1 hypothetical protein HYH03_018177 [Edaphochlamys debaryana]
MSAVPRRSVAALLERHPALLAAPVGGWVDFLTSFGFQRLAIQELLINSPDVLTSSNIFRAGQVFLFLKRLGVPNEAIVGPIFKWRALLAEDVDYEAAAAFLGAEGSGVVPPLALGQLAVEYPSLLAAAVEGEGGLRERLALLRGLGPEAPAQLRGVLWEDWCTWARGLAEWPTAVAPKLAALEGVMGSRGGAEALLRAVPEALKYPLESRLRPNVRLLTELIGLEAQAVASLLRSAPGVLALAPDQLESRWAFLEEAAGGGPADLLAHPPYLLASLSAVTGPRLFFVAQKALWDRLSTPPPTPAAAVPSGLGEAAAQRQAGSGGEAAAAAAGAAGFGGGGAAAQRQGGGRRRGRSMADDSDDEEDELPAASGSRSRSGSGSDEEVLDQVACLDLAWLVEGSDEEWLRRVWEEQRRKRTGFKLIGSGSGSGSSSGSGSGPSEQELLLLRGEWEECVAEWGSMLGWCADKAFTRAGRKAHREQLSLFCLLVQS